MSSIVGEVSSIWRYPVKSMAGEKIAQSLVSARGLFGDRAWAAINSATGEIVGAKVFSNLLMCRAEYSTAELGQYEKENEKKNVNISFPDGLQLNSSNPYTSAALSGLVNHPIHLSYRKPESEKEYYLRRRALSIKELKYQFGIGPDDSLPDLAIYPLKSLLNMGKYTAPPGTHFDAFPLHILTSQDIAGLATPGENIDADIRRFRPNIFIDSNKQNNVFSTDWIGAVLEIDDVVIKIGYPTVRCSMPMQKQYELSHCPKLATVLKQTTNNLFGVYGSVEKFGSISEGAIVRLHRPGQKLFQNFTQAIGHRAKAAILKASFASNERAVKPQDPLEKQGYRAYKLISRKDEVGDIVSFSFRPVIEDKPYTPFLPGQHLTLSLPVSDAKNRLLRPYTISSAPYDETYRISVKKVSQGKVSSWLHQNLSEGDTLLLRPPTGKFYIDPTDRTPLLLLCIGVGVTPMMSILHSLVSDNANRQITLLYGARNLNALAFDKELRDLMKKLPNLACTIAISDHHISDESSDFSISAGRIDFDLIAAQHIDIQNVRSVICGHPSFARKTHEALTTLGVPAEHIHQESFQPPVVDKSIPSSNVDTHHQVRFLRSDMEAAWSKDSGTLLDLAESLGLSPSYGCRYGVCEACQAVCISGTTLLHGEIKETSSQRPILLCSSIPTSDVEIDL